MRSLDTTTQGWLHLLEAILLAHKTLAPFSDGTEIQDKLSSVTSPVAYNTYRQHPIPAMVAWCHLSLDESVDYETFARRNPDNSYCNTCFRCVRMIMRGDFIGAWAFYSRKINGVAAPMSRSITLSSTFFKAIDFSSPLDQSADAIAKFKTQLEMMRHGQGIYKR